MMVGDGVKQGTPRSAPNPVGLAVEPDRHGESGSVTWAATILRDQGMPQAELLVVLRTPDRGIVHRYLNLHLERLEEWLATQRRTLAAVERLLADAAERRQELGGRGTGRVGSYEGRAVKGLLRGR
jgi:hypothetical protein